MELNVMLTKKQIKVLEYIKECVEREGRTPTLRQIGGHFKMRSTGSVRDILRALTKKGWLICDGGKAGGRARLNPEVFEIVVEQFENYTVKKTKQGRKRVKA